MNHAPLLAKNLRRASGLLTAALALLTLVAGRAAAQPVIQAEGGGTGVTTSGPTQDWRLNAYGTLRGGGSWRGRGDGAGLSRGLGVGGGLGVRLEIPVHEYVVIGPMLEYQVINPNEFFGSSDANNLHSLNFGVWSKGRYVLDLAGHPLEVYVALPLGLAIYVGHNMDTEVGVAVSLMFGAQFFLNDRIGFLLETGFRRDGFRVRDRDFDTNVRLRGLQFVMNAGISIAL